MNTQTQPKTGSSARARMVDAAIGLVLDTDNSSAEPTAAVSTPRRRATRAEAIGAEAIGIRAVAEAAGVTHAAPLHHFPDRVALLAAVGAEGNRRLAAALEAALTAATGASARRILGTVVQAQTLWVARHAGLWDVMCTPQLTAGVTAVFQARQGGVSVVDALSDAQPMASGSVTNRAQSRRAEAFDELVDAKLRVFAVFTAAVAACPAQELQMTRLTAGDRRPIVHALTTLADGLALQFLGESELIESMLLAHVDRTLDLLLAGVLVGQR